MRHVVVSCLLMLCLLGSALAYTQLIANSRYLENATRVLRMWAEARPEPEDTVTRDLTAAARARVLQYDDLISSSHLEDGMLVHRSMRTGQMVDQCDSLLFSSLRYVGLAKLGFAERAGVAWDAIQRSQQDGHWLRHPRCKLQSISRDMLVGLLVALSQQPPGFQEHLKALIGRIRENDGYFSTGPVYVSYLTPGIAKLMTMLAPASSLAYDDLPEILKAGYSTNEVALYMIDRGFQAHLVAMSVWLELEIGSREGFREPRSFMDETLDTMMRPFSSVGGLRRQRLDWTTHRLVQLDRQNLFFRYLRLRSAGALSPAVAHTLMTELLQMKQFPEDRLPMNCDRRADFMWQRASREYEPSAFTCSKQFHGADFVWMAALLTEAIEGRVPPRIAH